MLSRLFSNYLKSIKIKDRKIVLNFILKILQSAKNLTGSIFYYLNIAQLYIIMHFNVI